MVNRLAERAARAVRCCTPPAPSRLGPEAAACCAHLFRALADETRLQILGLLAAAREALCVCDIEANFALSQPTISHHLKVLREAGLVRAERRGLWVYYSLDRQGLAAVVEFGSALD
ncbi:MAG: winged helix-turn-helix transcriptional regulator [Armatimonadetes bacterium]|nr:winged helix-turn-helix transcriptional regulator [Armatimonadota bacterium]